MKAPVGIAFYTKETYKQLLERADDREALHDRYKDWLKTFKQVQATLQESSIRSEPFTMDMEALRFWCLQNDLPNIQSSRSRFVSYMLNNR